MKIQAIDKKTLIGLSILSIISGILFCVLQQGLLNIIFTVIGALMVVTGVIGIFKLNPIGGVLSIAIGALLIMGAWLFVYVLLIINGVLLLLSGISGFALSVKTGDVKNCILSILMVVLGILFFINTDATAGWIFFVIGTVFIVTGIVGVILACIPSKKGVKTVDVKPIQEEKK